MTTAGARPVVDVTGGGGGIGAALALELGRRGAFVVTVDPMVTLDGTGSVEAPEETTIDRIVAAGGAGLAAPISVTDGPAMEALFADLVATHGRLDAVVNVAGISRRTSYSTGTDDEWRSVLTVHLDGYRTVLGAALPIMAAAGRGRILGVTSGSGWRTGDAGAYGCAKRAVAALTWQLGRHAPPGVTVNAFSPIAVTRMVVAARGSAPAPTPTAKPSGGLSLGSMPEPEDLGPLVAWLVNDAAPFSGEIVFAGGSEVAVLDRPRLLEVVRTDNATDIATLIDATAPALAKAEATQLSGGGSNPRFTKAYGAPSEPALRRDGARCLVVSDRPELAAAVVAALHARGVTATVTDQVGAESIAGADLTGIDAVVLALAGDPGDSADAVWQRTLAEHRDAVSSIYTDARWGRAVADEAAASNRTLRIVTISDATTTGGRSRGQAAAQLSRAALGTTEGKVEGFAIADEGGGPASARVAAELTAHLVAAPDATALSGGELVTADGWFGLRSHPRAAAGFTFGHPEVPAWFGAALLETIDAEGLR